MHRKNIAGLGVASLFVAAAATAQPIDADAPRYHGPLREHVPHFDGTSTSSNWSGYAVTGSDFTSATGSWIVPAVSCNWTAYSSFWVGLDGYDSNTVEQTGTDSDCSGRKPKYYAWYEFYPKASVTISKFTVTPGDRMSAEVSYSGSTFTLTITDVTTGQTSTHTGTVKGATRDSAEWIAEAPCCTLLGGILPLADFGLSDFGLDYTQVSSSNFAVSSAVSGPVSAFGSNVDQIDMATKTVTKATTSSLSADGTSFSVNWEHK